MRPCQPQNSPRGALTGVRGNFFPLYFLKLNCSWFIKLCWFQEYSKVIQLHVCIWVFPDGTKVKNPPTNAGHTRDAVWIPGLGRYPEGWNGNPLQYSCLGNPMDREARRAAKSRTQLNIYIYILFQIFSHYRLLNDIEYSSQNGIIGIDKEQEMSPRAQDGETRWPLEAQVLSRQWEKPTSGKDMIQEVL